MNVRLTILFCACYLCILFAGSEGGLSGCLTFKAPSQGSIITAPTCTLGVDSSCKSIYKTEIKVRYFPDNADTAIVKTIGKIYRSPFKQIWDLQDISNQLFIGVGVIIEVSFSNGDVSGLFREGIFLTHKGVTYPPEKTVLYEYSNAVQAIVDSTVFPLWNYGMATVRMCWNENNLTFFINVRDTVFQATAPETILEQSGVEICIDPALKRRPYPTEDIMIFMIPLANKTPFRITYKPQWSDSGSFRLNPSSIRSNFEYNVLKNDRKGYIVTFSIPRYLFGGTLPEKMGYNIIVKKADTAGQIATASLIQARGYNNYSPFLWYALSFGQKPILKTRWIVWIASFFLGFLLPVLVYGITILFIKDRPIVLQKHHPDEKNKVFQNIKETIHLHITRNDISSNVISSDLGISAKNCEQIVKKVTGMSFKNYVMYLRTEIVCERLRSSHSSEVSIAETCGFKSVSEMERYFQKFHHTTPFNFRKSQQITQLQQ